MPQRVQVQIACRDSGSLVHQPQENSFVVSCSGCQPGRPAALSKQKGQLLDAAGWRISGFLRLRLSCQGSFEQPKPLRPARIQGRRAV